MTVIAAEIASRKRIALVAHDNKKQDLLEVISIAPGALERVGR